MIIKNLNIQKTILISVFIHALVFTSAFVLAPMHKDNIPVEIVFTPGNAKKMGSVSRRKKTSYPKKIRRKKIPKRKIVKSETKIIKKEIKKESPIQKNAKNNHGKDSINQVNEGGGIGRATPLSLYVRDITMQIERNKRYPPRARFLNQEGTVELKVKIKKNGNISNIEIVKSPSFQILVDSAISLVKKIGRFPSIPEDVGLTELNINIPIHYKLK